MMYLRNKKGALELSIGTIVILVLGMSMLILGLVLVRTIFTGAKYNVEALNKNVEAEINKLFNERGGRLYIYLPNNEVEVKQGESYGVAFAIKNEAEGESQPGKFTWEAKAGSVQKGCQLTLEQADNYLILGGTGSVDIAPGKISSKLIKVSPTSSAPLCEIQYDIAVKKDGQTYETSLFIVKIV